MINTLVYHVREYCLTEHGERNFCRSQSFLLGDPITCSLVKAEFPSGSALHAMRPVLAMDILE
jgi:hypothetical protein